MVINIMKLMMHHDLHDVLSACGAWEPTGLPVTVDKHKGVHKAKGKISLNFNRLVLDSMSDPITIFVLHVNPHCVILYNYVITNITFRL